MAAELVSSWGDAARGVGVLFREFFTQNTLAETKGWEPIVKYTTDDAAQATFSGKTGAGRASRYAEGAAIPKANRYKLYDTAFVHESYGGQLEITERQLMNREWSEAFDEFKDLTISLNVAESEAPAQILNGGFTNSGTFTTRGYRIVTYGDGSNIFSTTHPRVDGGSSQSNASATGIPLTETNFETGRIALAEQLQDDGTPIANMGEVWCVVPLALEKTAQIITGSTLRSGTANNDINIYSGGGYKVMSSVWLSTVNGGSNTQWQLVAPSVAGLQFVRRTGAIMDQSVDRNTKSTLFDVHGWFSVGSKRWHGTWASRGNSLAYAS